MINPTSDFISIIGRSFAITIFYDPDHHTNEMVVEVWIKRRTL
jgi:hypothetical protein